MRLAICLSYLLLATVQAETSKGNASKTEKRALTEGNAGLRKRAPVLPTVSSSANAGVEYADTKQTLQDKSPSQQVYASPTPAPEAQVTKISDLLAAQGPSFQAAIANQLYAPLPAYQSQNGVRAYEVSAPVPSQLAYSEHRIGYQNPNSLQYNSHDYNLKLPRQPEYNQQQIFNHPQPVHNQQQLLAQPHPAFNHQQLLAQHQPLLNQEQLLAQPQPTLNQHHLLSQPQQIYNHQPIHNPVFQSIPPTNYRPQIIPQNQYHHDQRSPQTFGQLDRQPSIQGFQLHQPDRSLFANYQQNILPPQFNLAPQPSYEQPQYQHPGFTPEPIQNVQLPQHNINYARQEEAQQNIFRPLVQNQIYEKPQIGAQNHQAQHQGPVSFASFPHLNPSIIHHPFPQPQQPNQQTTSSNVQERQPSYFRQGPQLQLQVQPQHQQPQAQYSKPTGNAQIPPAPTFPAVQYFGKYAQSIFNKPQQ